MSLLGASRNVAARHHHRGRPADAGRRRRATLLTAIVLPLMFATMLFVLLALQRATMNLLGAHVGVGELEGAAARQRIGQMQDALDHIAKRPADLQPAFDRPADEAGDPGMGPPDPAQRR